MRVRGWIETRMLIRCEDRERTLRGQIRRKEKRPSGVDLLENTCRDPLFHERGPGYADRSAAIARAGAADDHPGLVHRFGDLLSRFVRVFFGDTEDLEDRVLHGRGERQASC